MSDIFDSAFKTVYNEIIEAAMKRGYEDKALAFIVQCKQNEDSILKTLRSYPDGNLKAAKIERLLQGVPSELRCDCCSLPLKRPNHRGDLILGSCCVNHELGSCRNSQRRSQSLLSSPRQLGVATADPYSRD